MPKAATGLAIETTVSAFEILIMPGAFRLYEPIEKTEIITAIKLTESCRDTVSLSLGIELTKVIIKILDHNKTPICRINTSISGDHWLP